jgi:hypothetical protein
VLQVLRDGQLIATVGTTEDLSRHVDAGQLRADPDPAGD